MRVGRDDDSTAAREPFDGIVLAGGRASRFGGQDKTRAEVGGARLLDTAVAALAGAERRIVVGHREETDALDVRWTREEPAGGGPVAALEAGLREVNASVVVVLAADLPFVGPSAVAALVAALGAGDAVVAVDQEGRSQPLLAAYRSAPLRAALPSVTAGARLRDVVARLDLRSLELDGDPPVTWDCDTVQDLNRARRWK